MNKIDYRKRYHPFYSPPSDDVQRVTIPTMQFAMIDGKGSPEGPEQSPEFQNAIGALYGITYVLKIGRKKAGIKPDYTIAPLEGLWWMSDGSTFDTERTADWRWTLMIFQPEFITPGEFKEAVAKLKLRRPDAALDNLRLETFNEGDIVQTMHIGPYAEERKSIQRLQEYAASHGYKLSGKHHEIYLGDPRRTVPEKLRTILRRPVASIAAPMPTQAA